MCKTFGIALLIVLCAGPALGGGIGGIGIYAYPDGSSYCAYIQPNVPTAIYVLYLHHGGPCARGAEYRIAGMRGELGIDYLAFLVPAPGSNINLGNAFGSGAADGGGHNVAWPTVQPYDNNGNLLLATWYITLLSSLTWPAPTTLDVLHRDPPTNALFPCPLIVTEAFDLVCMYGGTMYINSPGAYCGSSAAEPRASAAPPCVVAVEKETWSRVRTLYR